MTQLELEQKKLKLQWWQLGLGFFKWIAMIVMAIILKDPAVEVARYLVEAFK